MILPLDIAARGNIEAVEVTHSIIVFVFVLMKNILELEPTVFRNKTPVPKGNRLTNAPVD